jgi:hypothetical protein
MLGGVLSIVARKSQRISCHSPCNFNKQKSMTNQAKQKNLSVFLTNWFVASDPVVVDHCHEEAHALK